MPSHGDESVWRPTADELALERRSESRRRRRQLLRCFLRIPTSALRALPDFLILGASKSGTTMLCGCIASHPDVRWAVRKEVRYFDHTYRRGQFWYRSFFPLRRERDRWRAQGGGMLRIGEGTPDYLFHPHAPQRVRETLPDAKLVVILRNPVDRAYSHYRHHLRRGFETVSFEGALEGEQRADGELERMLEDPRYLSFDRQHRSYLARGRYMEQLKWWLALVPREQLLVLLLEDFEEHAERELSRVANFLGLAQGAFRPPERLHAGVQIGPMEAATRAKLLDYFRPHNDSLAEFLGRELGWDS